MKMHSEGEFPIEFPMPEYARDFPSSIGGRSIGFHRDL